MPFSNFKTGKFNIKAIAVGVCVLAVNIFLFFSMWGSKNGTALGLSVSSFILVSVTTALFIRSVYLCSHEHTELGALKKQVADTRAHLELLEQQKTKALSSVLEKFTTPLQAIRGYSSMILEGTFGVVQGDAKSTVEDIYNLSERISRTVEDLILNSSFARGISVIDQDSAKQSSVSASLGYRVWAARLFAVVTLVVLLIQFLFAPSLMHLLSDVLAVVAFILMTLFVLNEISNEPGSKETIASLQRDLSATTTKLEEFESGKREFLVHLSADIHAPLVTIMDNALHLSHGSFEELSNDCREASAKIFESSERLTATISTLKEALL